MADDKTKTRKIDRDGINVNEEDYDLRYWSEITPERLKAALKTSGRSAKEIAALLVKTL